MRRCDGRRVRRPNPAALPRQSLLSITHRHHRLLIHRPSLLHVRETRLDDQVSSGFALSDLFSSTSVALGVGMFSPCRRSAARFSVYLTFRPAAHSRLGLRQTRTGKLVVIVRIDFCASAMFVPVLARVLM